MRILLQWSRADPQGWEEIDSTTWRGLPKRAAPTGGESLDDQPGWIFRLNVQGVEFTADHYAVIPLPGRACRVAIWNDDPEDYPLGERFARIWTFRPLRRDARFGGRWNTEQEQAIFADPGVAARMIAMGVPASVIEPFESFVVPDARDVRHGIWVPPELNDEHNHRRPLRGWRGWTEGVPAAHLDDRGHVMSGYPPVG